MHELVQLHSCQMMLSNIGMLSHLFMEQTIPKKLLCTWHVDRPWRRGVQRHVTEKSDQVSTYHCLRLLMNEENVIEFRCLLQRCMSMLSSSQPQFHAYFKAHYAQRTEEWAACHRSTTVVNTNMHIEAFHRLLKVVYLENKQNR